MYNPSVGETVMIQTKHVNLPLFEGKVEKEEFNVFTIRLLEETPDWHKGWVIKFPAKEIFKKELQS